MLKSQHVQASRSRGCQRVGVRVAAALAHTLKTASSHSTTTLGWHSLHVSHLQRLMFRNKTLQP
ncbi:hypothetical protein E2C01_003301 [Portunus trituberculatus]|uniref:Uncharacterized protein n=1 Tax=Portunus trituberculatus TaxID=210409 RepID=A0A5B7CLV0_PORTR|nr:hypothetical protein [Portunus trituberculatus]